jgi:hypothetical protein
MTGEFWNLGLDITATPLSFWNPEMTPEGEEV